MVAPVQHAPAPTIALYGDYAFNEYVYVWDHQADAILQPLGPYARVINEYDSDTDGINDATKIQVTLTGNLSVDELEHLYQFYAPINPAADTNNQRYELIKNEYGETFLSLFKFAEAQLKASGRIRDPERGVLSDIGTGFSMVGRAVADGFRQNIYDTRDDRTQASKAWNDFQKTKPGTQQRKQVVGRLNQELAGNSSTSVSGIFPLASMFQDISQSLLGVVRFYNDDVMEGDSYIPGGIAFGAAVFTGIGSTLYSGVAVTIGAVVDTAMLVGALGAQAAGYDAKNNLPLFLATQDLRLLVDTTIQLGTGLLLKPVAYALQGEFRAAGSQVLSTAGWDSDSDEKFVKMAEVGIFVGSLVAIPAGLKARGIYRRSKIPDGHLIVRTANGETIIPYKAKKKGQILKAMNKVDREVLNHPNSRLVHINPAEGTPVYYRRVSTGGRVFGRQKPTWQRIADEHVVFERAQHGLRLQEHNIRTTQLTPEQRIIECILVEEQYHALGIKPSQSLVDMRIAVERNNKLSFKNLVDNLEEGSSVSVSRGNHPATLFENQLMNIRQININGTISSSTPSPGSLFYTIGEQRTVYYDFSPTSGGSRTYHIPNTPTVSGGYIIDGPRRIPLPSEGTVIFDGTNAHVILDGRVQPVAAYPRYARTIDRTPPPQAPRTSTPSAPPSALPPPVVPTRTFGQNARRVFTDSVAGGLKKIGAPDELIGNIRRVPDSHQGAVRIATETAALVLEDLGAAPDLIGNIRKFPDDALILWRNRGRNVENTPNTRPPEAEPAVVAVSDASAAYLYVGGNLVTNPVALTTWRSVGGIEGILNYKIPMGWRKWFKSETLRFRVEARDPHGFPTYVIDRTRTAPEIVTQTEAGNMQLSRPREGGGSPIVFRKTSTPQGPVWRCDESLALDPRPPVDPIAQAASEALSQRVGPPRPPST